MLDARKLVAQMVREWTLGLAQDKRVRSAANTLEQSRVVEMGVLVYLVTSDDPRGIQERQCISAISASQSLKTCRNFWRRIVV